MSGFIPFDDTVQLEEMASDPFPDLNSMDDTDPIIPIEDEAPAVTVVPVSATAEMPSSKRSYVTVGILLLINLLNYMDRFTVAGVLDKIKHDYHVDNTLLGLLQTSFILSYMLFSPVFGYLGDRWIRKYLMAGGIIFWSIVTLSGSFMEHFGWFMAFRAMVGIGEASYSTIAPTLIADLFTKEKRSLMLMLFYFAIPVGSGMGYILSSRIAVLTGSWRWALRVTPVLGAVCVVLILVLLREPVRGGAEGGNHLSNTSWTTDLKALVRNKSFMLSSGGFTCVAFVTGALAFWAPLYMSKAIQVQTRQPADEGWVGLLFGIITCLAGFIGVAVGILSARQLKRVTRRADPLVCAFGMLTCTPFLYFSLVMSTYNIPATWALIFFGETMLCLNWAIVADMLLYCVLPTRRSTAEAFQILMSHTFGDAGSPYLIGQISTVLIPHYAGHSDYFKQFVTLQYALYITTFVCVIGGGFFLATALFIEKDRARVEAVIKRLNDGDSSSDSDDMTGRHGELLDSYP